MKYLFSLIICAYLFSINVNAQNNDSNHREALSAKEVVFLGIDFSKLRLIGKEGFIDKNGKTKCAALEFKYFDTWNEFFVLEPSKFNPNELLKVENHILSLDRSNELNKEIHNDECIIDDLSYKISESEIQTIVDKYAGNIKSEGKIAVLVISESMSKEAEKAKNIIVYFKPENGKILLTNRYESPPGGYGFNYYWINAIHRSLYEHSNYVKKTRKKLKIKF